MVRTGTYGIVEGDRPRYIVMTSRKAVTKDANGNSDLNFIILKKNMHPLILPFIGGGTVDNAAS